ncbi:NAD-dependent epimerase/dehydratase family protein [Psychrobacillus sp. FSL H8-0510]|uniref:NAD-dependent epimerase/dehydratase family protein n=1 Tax=Psychrobacillus sp. FSL H8-0510 TaxID=2921394 RepID=UPI0030F89FD1
MNIIVTGGQGFIGHNLILRLIKEGHNVKVFGGSNKNRRLPECLYIDANFEEISQYESEFENIDIIYHLLSTTNPKTSNENVVADLTSNVKNTIELLNISVKYNVKKFIFTSSGGTVYGIPNNSLPLTEDAPTNPICAYGISKLAIEKYLFMYNYLHGLNYSVLRIANPYGPYQNPFGNQGVISVFLGKIYKNEPIEIWGDGSISRDYVFIDDVTEALYASLTSNANNRVLNIGSGVNYSLNQILQIIKEVTQCDVDVVYKSSRKIDTISNILEVSKAKECLAWEAKVDIYEGVKRSWEWIIKSDYN